ncbi:hypothetical protein Tco_1569517 [Tanacetum coccineum]
MLRGGKIDVRLSRDLFIGSLAHHFGSGGVMMDVGFYLDPEEAVSCRASALSPLRIAPAVGKGDQLILHVLKPLSSTPTSSGVKTMPQRLGRLEEIQGLHRDVKSLRVLKQIYIG